MQIEMTLFTNDNDHITRQLPTNKYQRCMYENNIEYNYITLDKTVVKVKIYCNPIQN